MKNYNYFHRFGKNISDLMGAGRYILYTTLRSTLPRDGVQEKMDNFFRAWCNRHPKTARAFYNNTRIYPYNIWTTTSRQIFNLGSPVPKWYTNDVQLYSLSGNGDVLRWFELCMYVSIAKEFMVLMQTGKDNT